ncbi:MAG: ABC transporter permease [Calditrichaeota bacterium]|nr:MAG: ABC transporter permease [Calditrichota bacterium]MBL1206805.1 ABC transporter permease [Calditrichota bacterium]NOG46633.1 ABC transporter permease [Calditrichota bacterium]
MYLSLSWRNLWRNKRRTLIMAASVFFAVILASIMRSGQRGSYSFMIDSSAKIFTGYLQIQGEGFWDNRSLDKSIDIPNQQKELFEQIEEVTSVTPRLESFALLSKGNSTKVAQVIGIDPTAEDEMTGLKSRIIEGSYINAQSDGLLVGKGLASRLKAEIGDSLVLYGMGYHGQTAAAKLPISGIVDLPFEKMDNSIVYLELKNSQHIYGTGNRVTSLSFMISNVRYLDNILTELYQIIDPDLVVMTWDEMMPELKQNIQVDNISGIIMLIILYVVIGFGVFGTVMMMISERRREFSILISVGMKKKGLIFTTIIETILVSFLGVFAGVIGSLPLLYYLKNNPIYMAGEAAVAYEKLGIEPVMNFSTDEIIFFSQAIAVLIIAIFSAIYPFLFIRKLKPVDGLRA